MGDFDVIGAFLKLPPPVILVLTLNGIFFLLKKTACFPMRIVPWVSPCLGATVYPMIADTGTVGYAMRYPLAGQILLGFFLGFAAVGANQAFKKLYEKAGISLMDTEIITRASQRSSHRSGCQAKDPHP